MNIEDRLLLLVEDDEAFARVLRKSFERRGYKVISARSQDEMTSLLKTNNPTHAVVDLKLNGNTSGLSCVQALNSHNPAMLIVVLTGFASINTAVEAIKLGAVNYLCKPVEVSEVLQALDAQEGNPDAEIAENPPSVNRLTWEHIQRVLQDNDGNISATARSLGMHRRTLQRKLQKRPVKR